MTMPEEQGRKYRDIFDRIRAENEQYRRARQQSDRVNNLAKPECTYGYTQDQVSQIMGAARLYDFRKWMAGQTEMLCDGQEYNHETGKYEPTGCGPHGIITYRQDVERFLLGLPVVD